MNVQISNFYLDFIRKTQIELSDEYISSANSSAIFFGVIAFALTLFTAIAIKEGRVFGIFTAIMQGVGVYASQQMTVLYHQGEWFRISHITGTSQEDLNNKIDQFYADYFSESIPQMFTMIFWSTLVLVSWLMLLIYIGKIKLIKPRVIGVLAQLVNVVRYLFIGQIDFITPLKDTMTQEMQISRDMTFHLALLVPLAIIAIMGLINLTRKGDKKLS